MSGLVLEEEGQPYLNFINSLNLRKQKKSIDMLCLSLSNTIILH